MKTISYYNGDIEDSVCVGHCSILGFIRANMKPNAKSTELFKQIQLASEKGDKKLKNELKKGLHYFTPAVNIPIGKRRKYENIQNFTGYMQVDFDNEPKAELLKQHVIDTKGMVCAYLSPSKKGVKGLIRIPVVQSVEEYKEYFYGVKDYFESLGIETFDSATKNAVLPLYQSNDPKLIYNPLHDIWDVKGSPPENDLLNIKSEPPNIEYPEGDEYTYQSMAYFKRITIEIFKSKINEIVTEPGHPRLRDASLILGSRVGAGYLTQSEAESVAHFEISNNSYLRKDVKGYSHTASWAISQGIRNPKYYNI